MERIRRRIDDNELGRLEIRYMFWRISENNWIDDFKKGIKIIHKFLTFHLWDIDQKIRIENVEKKESCKD